MVLHFIFRENNMSVYFTSDLHLGHRLAAEQRGFDSIEEHDEVVIESIKRVVNKRSLLWVLGDVAMERDPLLEFKRIICRKRVVLGNHCKYYEDYKKIFEGMYGIVKYKKMWLTHCPIHPQEMYRCVANVHGHIHKGGNSPDLELPYINVNWDYWRRPVSLDEIKDIANKTYNCEEVER